MADRKVEGLWDCKYCQCKGIGGLTKECPQCGHPQDADTKFYMPGTVRYLDEETAARYGKGEDWTCSYCDTLNRYNETHCKGCGASRSESSGSYTDNQRRRMDPRQNTAQTRQETRQPVSNAQPEPARGGGKKLGIVFGVIIAVIVIAMIAIFAPRDAATKVEAKSWYRSIDVEAYVTVEESGWSVPYGGRTTYTTEEVRYYEEVLDHYEDVQVQRSRRVQDGYDTQIEYVDNGDGTFSEVEHQIPRYTTEYYYEWESEPVYVSVPVYDTYYYYDIDKWLPDRTEEASGTDDTPYWPSLNLASNEREGDRSESYSVTFVTEKSKRYAAYIPENLWNTLSIGQGAEITVSGGKVTQINDVVLSR